MQYLTVIGIDHGYGKMKTAHCCFPSHVIAHGSEDSGYTEGVLFYDGQYYTIGMGHKEFTANKIEDDDFYILTLAALAKELIYRGTVNARVHLAVGLPLTWVGSQRENFKQYLLRNQEAAFTYEGRAYHIEFAGADVFPQGASAVAARMQEFTGVNMLADIGNGTMNVMSIVDGRIDRSRCFTEKFGTYQCMLAAKEALLQKTGKAVHEASIEQVLRTGEADISERYIDIIYQVATEYVNGIFSKLREHEYDPEAMRLFVVGGGGCLLRNFGNIKGMNVTIEDDICATAKGYEKVAQVLLEKRR